MELIGVAGVIFITIAGFYFEAYLLRRKKSRHSAGKDLSTVTEAKAIVLALEQTGATRDQEYQVKIQMQVFPDRGRNFVVELKEIMSLQQLSEIHTGAIVKVTYNPLNHKEVSLIKTSSFTGNGRTIG